MKNALEFPSFDDADKPFCSQYFVTNGNQVGQFVHLVGGDTIQNCAKVLILLGEP